MMPARTAWFHLPAPGSDEAKERQTRADSEARAGRDLRATRAGVETHTVSLSAWRLRIDEESWYLSGDCSLGTRRRLRDIVPMGSAALRQHCW